MTPEENTFWVDLGFVTAFAKKVIYEPENTGIPLVLRGSLMSRIDRMEAFLKERDLSVTIRQMMECNTCKKEIPKNAPRIHLDMFNIPGLANRTFHLHGACFPWEAIELIYLKGGDKMGEPEEKEAEATESAESTEPAPEKADSE